jgi:hypothetical protein
MEERRFSMRAFDKLSILIVLALFLSIGVGTTYGAPKFPEKPITIIVHAAAGGGSDIFARTMAAANDKDKFLPQPIVVENKPSLMSLARKKIPTSSSLQSPASSPHPCRD